MHWKTSPLAKRSKELKGTSLGGAVEQMNRFAARQSYRVHEQVLSNPAEPAEVRRAARRRSTGSSRR